MTIAIQPIDDDSVTYYADSGTPVPSGYRQVPFEGSEAKDFSLNSKDISLPVSGTMKSSETPSWLAEQLAKIGLSVQSPQFGTGAISQGMGAAGMNTSLGEAQQMLKDAAGPTAGGMAGATLGGAAAGFLGPEAVPAGMYLGGVLGSGAGEGISGLIRNGQASLPDMGKVMALDAILGPLASGATLGGNAILRRLGLKGDLVKEAAASGVPVKMGKLDTAAVHELNVKPSPLISSQATTREDALNTLLADLQKHGRGIDLEMNPYMADSIRARIGKASENRGFEDTADNLYGTYMRDLRAQALLENNPSAQALVQKGLEENALKAIKGGMTFGPLGTGAGLGGLGSFMAYRFMNNPLQAGIAAGAGLTIPPILRMAPGLMRQGFNNTMMNPYIYGAVPGMGAGLMGIGE